MKLTSLLQNNNIIELHGNTREEVLKELVDYIYSKKAIFDKEEIYKKLLERELLESTAVENYVAIPHCKLEGLENPIIEIGISRTGINFCSSDKKLTYIFFLVISPNELPALHLKLLAAVAKIAKSKDLIKKIIAEQDKNKILQLIAEEEEKQILKSP